jgi:hypothetical protein
VDTGDARGDLFSMLTLPEYLPYAFLMTAKSSQTARSVQTAIYRKMTPKEKWAVAKDLYATAWRLKAAGVRHQHPEWTDEQVQDAVREIFLYATT